MVISEIQEVGEKVDTANSRLDKVETGIEIVETSLKKLREDIAPIKGEYTERMARDQIEDIAERAAKKFRLGYEFGRILGGRFVTQMIRKEKARGISREDIKSFRLADIIFQATESGKAGYQREYYIAIEVSYSVDERDVERAKRNAKIMELFEDKKCIPAVVGIILPKEREDSDVYWHKLKFDNDKLTSWS